MKKVWCLLLLLAGCASDNLWLDKYASSATGEDQVQDFPLVYTIKSEFTLRDDITYSYNGDYYIAYKPDETNSMFIKIVMGKFFEQRFCSYLQASGNTIIRMTPSYQKEMPPAFLLTYNNVSTLLNVWRFNGFGGYSLDLPSPDGFSSTPDAIKYTNIFTINVGRKISDAHISMYITNNRTNCIVYVLDENNKFIVYSNNAPMSLPIDVSTYSAKKLIPINIVQSNSVVYTTTSGGCILVAVKLGEVLLAFPDNVIFPSSIQTLTITTNSPLFSVWAMEEKSPFPVNIWLDSYIGNTPQLLMLFYRYDTVSNKIYSYWTTSINNNPTNVKMVELITNYNYNSFSKDDSFCVGSVHGILKVFKYTHAGITLYTNSYLNSLINPSDGKCLAYPVWGTSLFWVDNHFYFPRKGFNNSRIKYFNSREVGTLVPKQL